MSDIMMSPGLEDILDVGASPVDTAPAFQELRCQLMHPQGGIVGRLRSYADERDGAYYGGTVSLDCAPVYLPEALGCREFETMEISLGVTSMISRAIQGGWSQRREVIPHATGFVLVLSWQQQHK